MYQALFGYCVYNLGLIFFGRGKGGTGIEFCSVKPDLHEEDKQSKPRVQCPEHRGNSRTPDCVEPSISEKEHYK